jgi:hypothetical protein
VSDNLAASDKRLAIAMIGLIADANGFWTMAYFSPM